MSSIVGQKYNSYSGGDKHNESKRRVTTSFEITYFIQGEAGDDPASILATEDLPSIGNTLHGAPCRSRDVTEVDSDQHYWSVDCVFDEESSTKDLYLEPKWRWDFETVDEVLEFDPVTGRPITNVMMEKLYTASPVAIAVLNIEQYQNVFIPSTIFSFVNHVNSAPFWGAMPGYALMAGIRDQESGIDREDFPNLRYMRKVQYVIKFKVAGWMIQLLNVGTIRNPDDEGSTAPSKPQSCIDANGNPIQQMLGSDGIPLPTGTFPSIENGGWLLFNKYPVANFNALSLGPW